MSNLTVAVVLYDGMTTLDAVGPMEVLRFLPDARIVFVADRVGPIPTDTPGLTLPATVAFDDLPPPDVVVVPGGPGTAQALDGPVVAWLRDVHPGTRWTTSVCSGSFLLGAAGLIHGVEATSHFAVKDLLASFGALATSQRVAVDRERRVITSAGVSAGIDMALTLAAEITDELTAQAIQLVIEYDAQPPWAGGDVESAEPAVIERAIELGRPHGAIPDFWTPSTDTVGSP